MFYDLNVEIAQKNQRQTLEVLKHYGYSVVALNHTARGGIPSNLVSTVIHVFKKTLTPSQSDKASNLGLTSLSPTSYDLLAVKPTNEATLLKACTDLEVDIISFDCSSRLGFWLKHSLFSAAIQRGLHFEITYGAGVRDQAARRHLFTNAQALIRATRGKHLIISSEAQKALEVKGPYDVINLGTLFGLNQAVARSTLTSNCRAVIFHSDARRTAYKSVITVKSGQIDESDELAVNGSGKRIASDAGGHKTAKKARRTR
ncbi:hypothetical protein BZG36_04852 [Bifiguratus adelaidae]|uniref:Uncharacterized protein n=1 Tax=Bifiguratus adelaidae TaxID=1938954 RepID=A0A261XVM4_9FUNG|nr:hypothetical protein BZG36_04852 [Bifiguratus adelaidae]